MINSTAWLALGWGAFSAVSLPLGVMIGSIIMPAHPSGADLYMMFAMEGLTGGAMLTMIAQTI